MKLYKITKNLGPIHMYYYKVIKIKIFQSKQSKTLGSRILHIYS